MELTFEWDEDKNERNIRRRGIGFEEAQTVFRDPRSITIFDHVHSEYEQRFIDIGLSDRYRLLVVVYTERNARIRIISCRKAEPEEQRQYERQEG
jgi:uncharacterized DUF497 family protein